MSGQAKRAKLFKIKSGDKSNVQSPLFRFYGKGLLPFTSLKTLPSNCESPYEKLPQKFDSLRNQTLDIRVDKISINRQLNKEKSENFHTIFHNKQESIGPFAEFKLEEGPRKINPKLNIKKRSDYLATKSLEQNYLFPTPKTQFLRTGFKKLELISSNNIAQNSLQSIYKIRWFGTSNDFVSVESRLAFGKKIGEGAFAKVFEAIDKSSGKLVAAKIFDKRLLSNSSVRKGLQNEIDVLSSLSHQAIVRLLEVIEDQTSICLVLENWGNSSLRDWIHTYGWDSNAHNAVRDCGLALEYMHGKGFYHRDIKLTNIMIKDGRGCLVDFGMATRADPDSKEYLYCGTGAYLSPEMVSRTGYRLAPNDVWGFAVSLFRGSSGSYPFGGSHK